MKFSTFATTIIGSALLFASKAVADVDFFDFPTPNAVFRPGKTVQFVVDDLPDGDDGDDRIYADLYTESGRFVKTIRSWWGDDLDDNDEFAFSWRIDNNMKSGRYFIEMYSEDDDDDDDVSRSFMFEIAAAPKPVPRPAPRPATRPQTNVRGGAVRGGNVRGGNFRGTTTARRVAANRKDRLTK